MYPHVFLAGTFDGLHAGHRAILTRAFEEGERVTIGLTSDAFVRTYKLVIRPYEERKKVLEQFLNKHSKHATIISINDPYEPAASMKDLDALIVTKENRKTGERINELRQGSTLSALALIEVPMVSAEDGKPVSSTRLRNGEIDGDGRLVMPEELRFTLSKPLGKILIGAAIDTSIASHRDVPIITVGDMATKTILDAGVVPILAIFDGKVGRKPFLEVVNRLQLAISVKSGPGFISREAVEAIRESLLSHVSGLPAYEEEHMFPAAILIEGEEDLLVLPVIKYATIGSILYYGQPGKGLVEVIVTEKLKQTGAKLLHAFT